LGNYWRRPPSLFLFLYGAARLFTPAEVKELVSMLDDFSRERFRSRIALSELTENEIYPMCWDRPEEIDYLTEAFVEMCEFIRIACGEESGLVVMLF
jgi:hypothetical protein